MAFNLNLGNLQVHLLADASQFNRVMLSASAMMDKTAAKARALGWKMTTWVTLPLVGIGAYFVKLASDAEEIDSKFRVTFRNVIDNATAAMNELDKAYGMNATEAKKLMSGTGDLLTGFGFAQEEALDLSFQVQKLAVDLASFQNLEGGATRASEALTKAMLGERESAKLLGIVIREEDVQARILENQKKGLRYATENQAKAYAVLQIAMEQSKNAIGDYARTEHSFANRLRDTLSEIRAMGEAFGTLLLPYAQALLTEVRRLVKWFDSLSSTTKKWILGIGMGLAAIGPFLLILSVLFTVISKTVAAFAMLGVVGTAWIAVGAMIAVGIWAIVDAFVAADLGVLRFFNNIRVGGTKVGTWMEVLATYIWQAWDWCVTKVSMAWEGLKYAVMEVGAVMWRTMLRVGKGISDVFWTVVRGVLDSVLWLVRKSVAAVETLDILGVFPEESITDSLDNIQASVKSMADESSKYYQDKIDESLTASEQRHMEYYDALGKLDEKYTDQLKAWDLARTEAFALDDQALLDQQKVIDKFKKEVSDETDKYKKAVGAAAPNVSTSLSGGTFKEVSLRRISLESPMAARKEKQEVHDGVVARKLDQVIQILGINKVSPAVLG